MKKLQTAHELLLATIELLKKNGGSMTRSELVDHLTARVSDNNKERNRDNQQKWKVKLGVYTSPSQYGYLIRKDNRIWSLTEAADDWYEKNRGKAQPDVDTESADIPEPTQEEYGDNIADYIINMASESGQTNTGEILERITAALLRGMGYLYVEKRGGRGDGGVDVVGYKDKLGAMGRVKAQAKHYTKNQKITANDIKVLESAVHEGEIGMFVTTSSFTKDAIEHARRCVRHIFLVDIDRLVELWIEYYSNMNEQDKELIPLVYKLDDAKIKQRDGNSEKTE